MIFLRILVDFQSSAETIEKDLQTDPQPNFSKLHRYPWFTENTLKRTETTQLGPYGSGELTGGGGLPDLAGEVLGEACMLT